MRKIRLDVDQLAVESFGTAEGGAKARGTVRANESVATHWGDCLSGARPCEQSYAMTDGIAACMCMDPGETGIVC